MEPKKEKEENYIFFYPIIIPRKDYKDYSEIIFQDLDTITTNKCFSRFKTIENKIYFFGIYNTKMKSNKLSKAEIKFNLGEDQYKISFKIKNKISFVFQADLEKIKKWPIRNDNISQSIILFKEKFLGFHEALSNNRQMNYLENLLQEGIDSFKGEPSFEYFILLFSNCLKDKFINLLFNMFPSEFKKIKYSENNLPNLKETIENIYQEKNEIFNYFTQEKYKDSKIIFYFIIIYYFLLIKDEKKSFEIIQDLNNKENKEDRDILFHILKKYYSFFQGSNLVDKNLLHDLISDPNENNVENIKNILNYEKIPLNFLEILNNNKAIIVNLLKSSKKNMIINIYTYIRQSRNDDIKEICKIINILIKFEKDNRILFIEFSKEFWEGYLSFFNNYSIEDINKLINLRNNLKEYQSFIKTNSKFPNNIRNIIDYFNKDNYGTTIHTYIYVLVKNNINNKKFNELELLSLIFEKDPFYYENSKKKERDEQILKYIDFKNIKDEKFYKRFIELKIDGVFEVKIKAFYNFFFSLIENIFDFELIFQLFKIEKLSSSNSINEFIQNIINKFNDININIEKKNESEYNKIIDIIVTIIKIIIQKPSDKNVEFLSKYIEKKIKEKIYVEIYLKLLEQSEKNLNDSLIKYILKKISSSPNVIDYSIQFLKMIKNSSYRKKFFDILNGYTFEYKDFFNNNKEKEIELFKTLMDNNLIDKDIKSTEYYKKNEKALEEIKVKFNRYEVKISDIFDLIQLNEEKQKKRLKLISDNPNELYNNIKIKYKEVQNEIQEINTIKETMSKYHSKFIKTNKTIVNILSSLENGFLNTLEKDKNIKEDLNEFKEKNKESIETINKVEYSHFFNWIYREKKKEGEIDDEFKLFNKSIEMLNENEKIIEEPEEIDQKNLKAFIALFSNDDILEQEFNILSKYFNKEIDINLLKDKICILKNIEEYINEIKNILFFLEKIKVKQTEFSEKLKEICEKLISLNKENNKEIGKYQIIKNYLEYLDKNCIYNYLGKNQSLLFYKYLYDKELAIAFLLDKKDPDIAKALGEKLDPMETTLTNEDIDIFQNCIKFFQELKIDDLSDKEVFIEIKKRIEKDSSILNNFERYSNNYKSIKEIDENFDDSNSIMKKVEDNINTGIYYFYKIEDIYKNNDQTILNPYNELYNLKCKININADEKDEKIKEKNNKLKYFDNLMNKIIQIRNSVIYLRNKGSQINLIIEVHFCYNKNNETGIFILGKKEISFKKLMNYLNEVTIYYNDLLKRYYLENEYIRFTYGKQFNFITNYLLANNNDNSFANYFLNKRPKKELYRAFPLEADDSIKYYDSHLQNTLDNISNYIKQYFEDNYEKEENDDKTIESLEKFYNIYKVKDSKIGIYYMNSEQCSIEEQAINLFIEITEQYPLSQNIILINQKTSDEEIESFLFRALLCKYHTLFIIGINDITISQEDNLLKYMNFIIDSIKIRDNKNINLQNLREIKAEIKSCIIFVYNKETKFIKNITKLPEVRYKKLTRKNEEDKNQKDINSIEFGRRESYLRNNSDLTSQVKVDNMKSKKKVENVLVYLSDVNGTGKTWAIRNDIKDNKLIYKYLPFGGDLTKNLVYHKIKTLLDEIKNEEEDKICIHLDLYETEEKEIMNDFLFSFLFTKYYKNDENVIYIPREIKIYVEVPNCFINFTDAYPILNIFQDEQLIKINLEEPRPLILEHKEKELFSSLNIENVEEFIKNNIKINFPSYYQKRQFINSFLSQITKENASELDNDNIQKIINSTNHFTQNCYSDLIKQKNNILTDDGILDKLSEIDSKNANSKYDMPLIFYDKNDKQFFQVNMSEDHYKDYTKEQFLKDFKYIFNLNNPIKKIDNKNSDLKSLEEIVGDEYVITVDNFRKMVKIYYRIISNINLIIMGETGCGKTLLISKLYAILHNGEKKENDFFKINIHGGYTDDKIIEEINEINKKVSEKNDKNKKIWVFIDEINACKSMGLFNEIICNHSFNGKKLNENIVFIGACNPYRKSKNKSSINGLVYKGKEQSNKLYNVNPLSHSLMNFVFYFGALLKKDEKEYISAIIKDIDIFQNNNELKDTSTEMLYKGHSFIKEKTDASSVSLREINRFKKCFYFFKRYYENKKEVLNDKTINEEKLNDNEVIIRKAIILSILTCYYLKISDISLISEFDGELKKIMIGDKKDNEMKENKEVDIKMKNILNDLEYFSDILKHEEKFILEQIELDNGIADNRPLRDNIFLLFVSINLFIPIFIVGKPGCSKTLSVNLIDKSMSGKYSKKPFFRQYPALFKTWFQGTETTSNEDVENLFKIAEKKIENVDEKSTKFYGQHPISLIFFDEIGLCEISEKKPLKILNFKFEYESKMKYLSFIGISNWILDAAKMNRGFTLSVPELHENRQDIIETCEKLVKSINNSLYEDNHYSRIFNSICMSYINYKKDLPKKYKIEESENPLCHGSRDFYYLIKNISYKFNNILNKNQNLTLEEEIEIVFNAIERNFGSLTLNGKDSSIIFKTYYLEQLKIKDKFEERKEKNNIIKNIISNIIDKKSRNLLLITKSSLNSLIVETLLSELKNNKETSNIKPIFKIGSSFKNDKGEEYKLKIINQIQEYAKKGEILILQNFANILSSLYELFNLNYIKKDGKNYARISVGNSREQFIEINEKFKVILLYDFDEILKIMQPTASRFEKMKVEFDNLITKEEKENAITINSMIINKLTDLNINKPENLKYLKNLIINLDDSAEEIMSMIYYF